MLKSFLSTATILFLSGAGIISAQQKANGTGPRFLEDIVVDVVPATTTSETNSKAKKAEAVFTTKKEVISPATVSSIESADKLQFKYSLLLDTEVEQVQNISLIKLIDEWMGTRYRLGGTSKAGIDCSALMQVMFASLYGITLPRTSREQFSHSRSVNKEEMKEGDLIFFNTTGKISHVGFYLQNNKFVHASTSGGVTISDLDEEYWSRKFAGVRRIEESSTASASKP